MDRNAMYQIKPVFELNVELFKHSDSMYRLKNLKHGHLSTPTEPENAISSSSRSLSSNKNDLLERQEKLLSNLKSLQIQFDSFKNKLSDSKVSLKKGESVTSQLLSNTDVGNFVINADPNYPPFALVWLTKLWNLSFKFSIHVHSSVISAPAAVSVFDRLKDQSMKLCSSNVTFVWKNVGRDPQLILSPLKYKPIHGEVNILRLFDSVMSTSEELIEKIHSHELLDLCHRLYYSCNREHKAILTELEKNLGENQWFLHKRTPTIVDAALWSVMSKLERPNILSHKLKKWIASCNAYLELDISA